MTRRYPIWIFQHNNVITSLGWNPKPLTNGQCHQRRTWGGFFITSLRINQRLSMVQLRFKALAISPCAKIGSPLSLLGHCSQSAAMWWQRPICRAHQFYLRPRQDTMKTRLIWPTVFPLSWTSLIHMRPFFQEEHFYRRMKTCGISGSFIAAECSYSGTGRNSNFIAFKTRVIFASRALKLFFCERCTRAALIMRSLIEW